MLVFFLVALVLVLTIGKYLTPILIGFVFAYVLQGLVDLLVRWRFPRLLGIVITLLIFLGGFVALVIVVLPVVWTQLQDTVDQLPRLANVIRNALNDLSEQNPTLVPTEFADDIAIQLRAGLSESSVGIATWIFEQIPNVIAVFIFVVLVPIATFFFLKDRQVLVKYMERFLPQKRPVMRQMGHEITVQIGSYIRGKFLEILIVGCVTYVVFLILGLQYAALLSLLVGLSVIIPFIGAALVTIPVVAVAMLQFGMSAQFFWIVIAYTVIQALDGNLLVPLLFAEVVKLHPLAIITSVLVFGGLWGIWGLFFAIPLAILIKALVNSWPTVKQVEESTE